MATSKNPWTKYIVLLVIALLLLGVNYLKNKKYQATSEAIFEFSKEDVTEITIRKDTLATTLVKGDTSWVFAAPDTGKVNQGKVDRFLENVVEKAEYTGFQTKNPDNYGTYNISDNRATHLTLKVSGDSEHNLFVSRSKSNWAHDYIRYPSNPKVYITAQKIMYHFSERPDFWRQ